MDIKPFNQPVPDFWASLDLTSMIFLGIAALALLSIIFVIFFENLRVMALPLTMVSFIFCLSGMAMGHTDRQNKHVEHYNDTVSGLKASLADDGFKTISGTPDLHPNTQSSMLLSYEGKNFDCTMFSPEDVNTSIVFSCGEAKLTLTEVKNNGSK